MYGWSWLPESRPQSSKGRNTPGGGTLALKQLPNLLLLGRGYFTERLKCGLINKPLWSSICLRVAIYLLFYINQYSKRSVLYLLCRNRRLGSCFKVTVPSSRVSPPLQSSGQILKRDRIEFFITRRWRWQWDSFRFPKLLLLCACSACYGGGHQREEGPRWWEKACVIAITISQ